METNTTCNHNPKRMKKIIFGLLVIAAGALLLGFNTGWLPIAYKPIFFSWQMLLISIGLINLFSRESWMFGFILIVVGSFFIIPLLCIFPYNYVNSFWPALLIVAGILIIFRRRSAHHHHHRWEKWHRHYQQQETVTGSEFMNEENIFSGSKKKFNGEFKGGRISNVFGGLELDLTQATLPEGKTELVIECVFGGVTLIVPADWTVQLKTSSVMGGFVDKRSNIRTMTDTTRELIIKGSAIFGGGEIKSF